MLRTVRVPKLAQQPTQRTVCAPGCSALRSVPTHRQSPFKQIITNAPLYTQPLDDGLYVRQKRKIKERISAVLDYTLFRCRTAG
jgi:hypothetical protein